MKTRSITILNVYNKETLNNFVFIKKLNKEDFNLILDMLKIKSIETTIFTKDNNFKEIFIENISFFTKTLTHSIISKVFNQNKISFSNTLVLLNYYLNYFDYTIIKYQKYLTNIGMKNIYQIVDLKKIKLIPNFTYSNFENETISLVQEIEYRILFNTTRDKKVIVDFN